MRRTTLLLSSMLFLFGACTSESDTTTHTFAITAGEADGLLEFVNDQAATTLDVLDVQCAIRSDSAANIIAHRDGPDGNINANDNLFDDVDELDGVYMVGAWTLEQLRNCAIARGYIQPPACADFDADNATPSHELFYGDLDADLAGLVDATFADAELYRDTNVYFDVRFGHVEVYTDANGAIAGYRLVYLQWIDPEGGIQLYIVFDADACFNVQDVDVYI